MASGGQFTYRSIEWRSGKIVFLEALFSQSLSYYDMNVEIKAPCLAEVAIPPFFIDFLFRNQKPYNCNSWRAGFWHQCCEHNYQPLD